MSELRDITTHESNQFKPTDEFTANEPDVHNSDVGRIKSRWARHWRRTTAVLCLISAFIGAIIGSTIVIVSVPLAGKPDSLAFSYKTDAGYDATLVSSASSGQPAVIASMKLGPSVVGVTVESVGLTVFGRTVVRETGGSGVIITGDGYVVTNNHVVEGARSISVVLADGRRLPARLVGVDKPTDLAVIKLDGRGFPAAELGDSDLLRVGETVVAIGSPISDEFRGSVTQGIVSGLKRTIQLSSRTLELIQTDAVINPGNSGGPLANSEGKVIGINALKIDHPQVEGMGFAVPINVVRPIVARIIEKDSGRNPFDERSLPSG